MIQKEDFSPTVNVIQTAITKAIRQTVNNPFEVDTSFSYHLKIL